jgi:hypothetical protein
VLSDGGEFVIESGIEAAGLKGGGGGAAGPGGFAVTVGEALDAAGDAGFKGVEVFVTSVFPADAAAGMGTVATGRWDVTVPAAGGASPGLWSCSDIGERHR